MNGEIIALKTAHGTYLSAWDKSKEFAIVQAGHSQEWEHFVKSRNNDGTYSLFTAHKLYVSACWETDPTVRQVDHLKSWEKFTIVNNDNGTISLKTSKGTYISARNDNSVRCEDHNKEWEQFTVQFL